MTDREYALEIAKYRCARMTLTLRENGMRSAPVHPECGLLNDFSEADVQAMAARLRDAWSTRPHPWTPQSEAEDSEAWVRLPDDPDALIRTLDAFATEEAIRFAWSSLQGAADPQTRRLTMATMATDPVANLHPGAGGLRAGHDRRP